MKQSDITINITAHSEGLLLHKTLRSVLSCYVYAKQMGIKDIDFNLSLDSASPETKRIAEMFCSVNKFVKMHTVTLGDLALHRNYLIANSKSKYIAFFDGDDLFTENYLYEAYNLAEKNVAPAVYSPEFLVSFQDENYISRKYDSYDPRFHVINLFEYNYFISQSFVSSDIYNKILYRPNISSYGMEDWDWNNQVINAGFDFINIPNTIFCYRRKKNGLMTNQLSNSATLRPSVLFEPHNFRRFKDYTDHKEYLPESSNKHKYIKTLAKKATFGIDAGYDYLRQQYHINRKLFSRIHKNAKNKFFLKEDKSLSEDIKVKDIPNNLQNIGVDNKLLNLWKNLNSIEPLIAPSSQILKDINIVEYPQISIISKKYYELCNAYGNNQFIDMVLVPHIIRGGADLAIIKLVKTVAKRVKTNIFVFTTSESESTMASEISGIPNVVFIELDKYLSDLDQNARILFLLRILQNWGINRLHIINSSVGYELLEIYGKIIKENIKVYLHTYAFDRYDDGLIFNYLSNGLVKVYDYVDMFITDSETYKNQLIEINGFEASKIEPLFLPIEEQKINNKPVSNKKSYKVLWASRISDSKLVEVAVMIGKELAKHNIELHFYGVLDSEYALNNYFYSLIEPYNNIHYHGEYDGFETIDNENYDMLLLTSKNEGLPNIVLEALSVNLFVIAPNVGGIPEVIKDGTNGFLVDSNFSYHEYLEKILNFYDTEIDLLKLVELNKCIMSNHSPDTYRKNVYKILDI